MSSYGKMVFNNGLTPVAKIGVTRSNFMSLLPSNRIVTRIIKRIAYGVNTSVTLPSTSTPKYTMYARMITRLKLQTSIGVLGRIKVVTNSPKSRITLVAK